MKYKLLKPIRGIKESVGDISEQEPDVSKMGLCVIQLLMDGGYIEEYDPNKRWEPKFGEIYYCPEIDGYVSKGTWMNSDSSKRYLELGLVFRTMEEAQQAAEKVKELFKSL